MLQTTIAGDSTNDGSPLQHASMRLARIPFTHEAETITSILGLAQEAVGADFVGYWRNDSGSSPEPTPRLTRGTSEAAELSPDLESLNHRRLSVRHAGPLSIVEVGIWTAGVLVGCLTVHRSGGLDSSEAAFLLSVTEKLAAVVEAAGRRRAEASLLDRETRLDEIEELTNLGSWEWHPSDGTILWSTQQLRIHGIPLDQHQRTFEEFLTSVHPEDQERVLEECDQLIATGRPFSFPYRIVRKDGSVREMHALGKLVPDPNGVGLRAVGTSQDVTERNNAERALRASEESYRTIFECASEGIWLHDVQTGEMVDANAAGGALYGYTVEEMKEIGHDALNYPDSEYNAERVAEYMQRVLAGESPRFEWLGKHKDGSEVWGEVTLRKVVIGGEERILASTRDIRERKKVERELQRANEELERRVADRTAELAAANAALASEVREHQLAREQLSRRTSELEGVFAALPDVYLRLGANGQILDYRAGQGATPLGDAQGVIGRTLRDVLPPEVADQYIAASGRVERAGQLVCLEYELPRNGATRSFEARLLPAGDGSLITIVRDITDRKESEAAVRKSEEHFRALIENGSDYIMIVDSTAAITYIAPSSERILGWTQEEMLGKRPTDLVHPDDHPQVYGTLEKIIGTPGTLASSEYRVRHKDGSWRVMESYGRTLNPESLDAGIVVNGRDVTERKVAEEAVIRQKAYFEEILDSLDAGISVFDRQGRFEYASTQSIRDPEIRAWAIGKTIAEYGARQGLAPEVVQQRQRSIEQIIATRQPNQFEQEITSDNGGVRHLLRRIVPILDDAGEVVRMVGFSIDISERKKAEVGVQKAMEEAERANRAKSEFLSRMSHELRTPLNGILGFAQVLERNGLRPEQQKYVGHILKGGRHLLRLINEVLELSRIEAGRMSLSLEPIQVNSVIREGLDLVRPLAEQARIELDILPSDEPEAYVRADRQRIVQVLLNLLSNGIKYNRPGGSVRISMSVAERDPDRLLSIRVSDTGRGIPEDRLDQLFVPFARLGAEQTETEGTGLGLALSKRLAEAMGGALVLESTGREGSVFRLDLKRAGNPLEELKTADGEFPSAAAGEHAPATILYIEDNLTNLSLVETFLESKPEWRTISALRGRTGIELARERRPDLILLDLHLPDLHGEEVLKELRGDSRTDRIPVVVISADATPAAIQRLRAAGADAYLTKPIDLDEFMAAVERFITPT